MADGAVFLTSQGGEPPLPVMMLIIIACLFTPFLIKKKTGKSIYDWLGSLTLLGRMQEKEEKSKEDAVTAKGKSDSGGQVRKEQRDAQNDWMWFLKQLLDFARKNGLFLFVPGNIEWGGKSLDLTMILITRARTIGLTCLAGEEYTDVAGTICDTQEAENALRGVLAAAGLPPMPCEYRIVLTGRRADGKGSEQAGVMSGRAFFKEIGQEKDLHTGGTDPKKAGRMMKETGMINHKKES